MMSFEHINEKNHQHHREKIVAMIKKDPRYALLFLAPGLKTSGPFHSLSFAKSIGIEERDARYFEADLLRVGLWRFEGDRLKVESDFMDLGELKVIEFMTMTMNVLSKMSEEGPCWYEALYVSTTQDLKKEFLANINRVLRDFVKKSAEVQPDTVLAWTHGSLDLIKQLDVEHSQSEAAPPEPENE